MQIGLLIKRWLDSGHSAQELAETLGCHGQTVSDWRKGARPVAKGMSQKLGDALGVNVKEVEDAVAADARLRDQVAAVLNLNAAPTVQNDFAAFLERAAEQGFIDWHTLLVASEPYHDPHPEGAPG